MSVGGQQRVGSYTASLLFQSPPRVSLAPGCPRRLAPPLARCHGKGAGADQGAEAEAGPDLGAGAGGLVQRGTPGPGGAGAGQDTGELLRK